MKYPKRLIEVDLPIKRISVHARREKSIRHGHISTLHIWWARRPLAACRAVLCASLWPDPVDPLCPTEFIENAQKEMIKWSDIDHLPLLSNESIEHFMKVNHNNELVENKLFLRTLLFDFIADFANWDNSNKAEYLVTSRSLTQSSHIALGGEPESRPLSVDPFAGGGAIPLESSRVGCEAFASDLNPVSILLNRAHLEIIPTAKPDFNKIFNDEAEAILKRVNKKISKFYSGIENPKASFYIPKVEETIKRKSLVWKLDSIKSETPIAYLWARKIKCEGPGCGIEIPLLRTTKIVNKTNKSIFVDVTISEDGDEIITNLIQSKSSDRKDIPTVKKGAAICPKCNFITKAVSVRSQLKKQNGGANSARLIGVVTKLTTLRSLNKTIKEFDEIGKFYRNSTNIDLEIIGEAEDNIKLLAHERIGEYSLMPNEPTPDGKGGGAGRAFSQRNYGIDTFSDVYTHRQLLTLTTFAKEIFNLDCDFAIKLFLSFALGRVNDLSMSLCRWLPSLEAIAAANGGQNRMPVTLDFTESNPLADSGGNWLGQVEWISRVIENLSESSLQKGSVLQCEAQNAYLPNESVDILFTDPPYYDAFPYSDLSDYFFVWLKRCIGKNYFQNNPELVPKEKEIVVYDVEHGEVGIIKDNKYFSDEMTNVFEAWRIASKYNSICVVVFANKTLHGWESMIKGLVDSGWIITGSWPIDTERENRQRAQGSAALASSIHLVCRPRENEDGSLIQNQIGDWRDVQHELPKKIHEWMPRLADEGVAGADAIFACLGPALEIFSRYTKVVQAGSEREISLHEYLEKVWTAVSQEALNMVFSGGEAQGLEEDARLTAMWLWTLTAGASDSEADDDDDNSEDEEISGIGKTTRGFTLEYDTARKIAQGLGANLDDLKSLVEIKGDKARLLPVIERTSKLFGSAGIQQQPVRRKKKEIQLSFFIEDAESEVELKFEMPELKVEQIGRTVLDRLHQAMLLFSSGRTEALKRFLVEDGAGNDDRFWKLAQSLTSLYPKETDERRWVEAIQTYKKSLGF